MSDQPSPAELRMMAELRQLEPVNAALWLRAYVADQTAELRAKVDSVFPLWAKWQAEARRTAKYHRMMGDRSMAARYDAVTNTYTACEHNLREALKP